MKFQGNVRQHRRTTSSINIGSSSELQHKKSPSNIEDLQNYPTIDIPKLDLNFNKAKTKLRQRHVSDLIEACNQSQTNKSIIVQQLNISINYKDPSFQFGKKNKLQVSNSISSFQKVRAAKQLDKIIQTTPKINTARLFLKKKPIGVKQSNNISLRIKSVTSISINPTKKLNKNIIQLNNKFETSTTPLNQKEIKPPIVIKKKQQINKIDVKRNFKF